MRSRGRSLPWLVLLLAGLISLASCCHPNSPPPPMFSPPVHGSPAAGGIHTFSMVGFDPATGDLGVAVQSKFFGVGTVVPWAKAKVGAIATQSYANIDYGPDGLRLLEAGHTAEETLQLLTGQDRQHPRRQVGIVDAQGRAASYSGEECNPWAGHHVGKNFCAQGNLLAGEEVIPAMVAAYQKAQAEEGSELADWLMAALQAGQAAGGDKRGQQSTALVVVREGGGYGRRNDRYIDLRVEDHAQPIGELARLLAIHKEFYARAHARKPAPAAD